MREFLKDYSKNWKFYLHITIIDLIDHTLDIFGRDYESRYIRQEQRVKRLYEKYNK